MVVLAQRGFMEQICKDCGVSFKGDKCNCGLIKYVQKLSAPKEEPDYKALYHFALGWIEARAWGVDFRLNLKEALDQKDK